MKFALLLCFLFTALGEKNSLRGKRQLKILDDPCVASIVNVQYEDGTDDQFMTCETPSGKSYKVKAADKNFIKNNFGKGKYKSGDVDLTFDEDFIIDEATAEINSKNPPEVVEKNKKFNSGNKYNNNEERELQTQVVGNCGTYLGGSCAGTRTILVVRVIAVDKSTTASESQLAESIFENTNDSLNLQSWYKECSYNQLNFAPAIGDGINNGVTTVTVPSSTTDGDSVMNNDIVSALNTDFNVTSPNQIADHIMFCLPPGTMNGIAYANVNNWRSVYSDNWCTYASAQAHEIGHNLSLAHSGDPAGTGSQATYGDKSGMMGFSHNNDDGPRQCFNAPKNWQLGWYADKHVSVSFDGWEGNLIGISDYGNSNLAAEDMVIAKADLNESYYVSFNRKTGINSGTLEGGDQVMVHKRDLGTGYGDSDVLAYLNSGGTYSSSDSNFVVTVNSIDLTSNPARANVKVERFDPPPPCYTGTVSILINPDPYPGETSWDIIDDAENVIASGGAMGESDIVLGDGYYTFSIYDSYGDGICCNFGNGSYTLQIGSTFQVTGSDFGSVESTAFGICNNVSPTVAPANVPTSPPTALPTKSPTLRSTFAPSSVGDMSPHTPFSPDNEVVLHRETPTTSSAPSHVPSKNISSAEPSSLPNFTPSILPSSNPSLSFSSTPSLLYSDFPSTTPSDLPSLLLLSSEPTLLPSDIPSVQASMVPSSILSLVPSFVQSDHPSQVSSMLPSDIPSVQYSFNPSSSFSIQPSIHLSSSPSEEKPSSSPSLLPSDTPSLLHSSGPSSSPSLLPSKEMSKSPSNNSSTKPSSLSTSPSNNPTNLNCELSGPQILTLNGALRKCNYITRSADKLCIRGEKYCANESENLIQDYSDVCCDSCNVYYNDASCFAEAPAPAPAISVPTTFAPSTTCKPTTIEVKLNDETNENEIKLKKYNPSTGKFSIKKYAKGRNVFNEANKIYNFDVGCLETDACYRFVFRDKNKETGVSDGFLSGDGYVKVVYGGETIRFSKFNNPNRSVKKVRLKFGDSCYFKDMKNIFRE